MSGQNTDSFLRQVFNWAVLPALVVLFPILVNLYGALRTSIKKNNIEVRVLDIESRKVFAVSDLNGIEPKEYCGKRGFDRIIEIEEEDSFICAIDLTDLDGW